MEDWFINSRLPQMSQKLGALSCKQHQSRLFCKHCPGEYRQAGGLLQCLQYFLAPICKAGGSPGRKKTWNDIMMPVTRCIQVGQVLGPDLVLGLQMSGSIGRQASVVSQGLIISRVFLKWYGGKGGSPTFPFNTQPYEHQTDFVWVSLFHSKIFSALMSDTNWY